MLLTAPWPGNVRELRNVIERICILTDDRFFTEKETLACVASSGNSRPESIPGVEEKSGPTHPTHLLADAEREHITRILRGTSGNKKAAAQVLGLSRRALYRKLDRLGLR
jgi:two-component system response regulator HydG